MSRNAANIFAVSILALVTIVGSFHLIWRMLEEHGPKGGEMLAWLPFTFPIPFAVLAVIVGGISVPLMLSVIVRKHRTRLILLATAVAVQIASIRWIWNYEDCTSPRGFGTGCRRCDYNLLGCELVVESYPYVVGLIWLIGLGVNWVILTERSRDNGDYSARQDDA